MAQIKYQEFHFIKVPPLENHKSVTNLSQAISQTISQSKYHNITTKLPRLSITIQISQLESEDDTFHSPNNVQNVPAKYAESMS